MTTSSGSSGYSARLVTRDGHAFKLCMDLVSSTTKTCTMTIHSTRAIIHVIDSKSNTLIQMDMPRESFVEYEFQSPDGEPFGVDLPPRNLYRVIKSMRKRDWLEMNVRDGKFGVTVFPEKRDRAIQATFQSNVTPHPPTVSHALPEYTLAPAIEVVGNDFAKLMKDLCATNAVLTVTLVPGRIEFCSDNKRVLFGDTAAAAAAEAAAGSGSGSGATKAEEPPLYSAEFESSLILGILKVASVSRQVFLECMPEMPLCLRAHAGGLGTVYVYIKSTSQDAW
jgi:hypothetical protein